MRLSMISRIIKEEVYVIHRSRRLRLITQTEAMIILDIMRKQNNCFIMYSKRKNKEQYKWNTRKFHAKLIRTTFFFNVLLMQQCF